MLKYLVPTAWFACGCIYTIMVQPYLASPAIVDLTGVSQVQICGGAGFKVVAAPSFRPVMTWVCAESTADMFDIGGVKVTSGPVVMVKDQFVMKDHRP